MTIISKKTYRFVQRDNNGAVIDTREVRPHILTGGLPAWVEETDLFKLAVKEKSITFVEQPKAAKPKADDGPPKINWPQAFLTPDEVAALGRPQLLEYAAHIGFTGFANNIGEATLANRINEFIAARLKEAAPDEE